MTYSRRLLTIVILLGLFQSTSAQEGLIIEEKVMTLQKEIVATLAGIKPIQPNVFLGQRASSSERRVTAEYLLRQLIKKGWTPANHNYREKNSNLFLDLFFKPTAGTNVSAILPSTTASDEFILFGAHYDSERGSPGAIDNATGVALLMGLIQQLTELKVREKNLRVVFFDQEEDDEVGSGAFVEMIKKEGIKVHSVHIMDMMGWDADKDRAVAFQSYDSTLQQAYTEVALKYDIPFEVIQGGASDNRHFQDAGYKTLATFEPREDTTPFIHRSGDTYDTVDFDYLASTTQVIFLVFKNLLHD